MLVRGQLVVIKQPQAAIIMLLRDDAKVVVEVGNDFARADVTQAREFMLDVNDRAACPTSRWRVRRAHRGLSRNLLY